MFRLLLLWSIIVQAPETEHTGSAGDGESYEAALEELEQAEAWSDTHDGSEVGARLERAIAQVVTFGPELAADEAGRESLLYARLSLARNYYIMDPPDPEAGEAAIDFILRTTIEIDPKIIERFRPYFGDRYEARKAALEAEGKATIEVVCHVPCRVAVNQQPVAVGKLDVYLGTYTVMLSARDGSLARREVSVTLTERGQVETLGFGAEPVPVPAPVPAVPAPSPPAPTGPSSRPAQVLPRWLEISGIVAGAGLIAGGIAMFTVDGTCPDPGLTLKDCPKVWESTPAGAITLGIGSALLFSSTALLIVDERRSRRPNRRYVRFSPPGVIEF